MCPKISVIIPVYNAELYIQKCIESLLAQTFIDFEIILIDDGSIDNSGNICDEYELKDKRIKVIHKQNGGVSSARQCGIENSQGIYVIHVDPDDWVEINMLEELYYKACEKDYDMVICDFYEDFIANNISKYIIQKPSSLNHNDVLKEIFQTLHGSCCNKLVKRTCFIDFNIKFPFELATNEDQFVIAALLKNNIKIAYLPKAFYHYMQDVNKNSLVKTRKKYSERLKMVEMFCNLMRGHKYYKICEQYIICNLVTNIFSYGIFSSNEFKREMFKYRKHIIKNTNLKMHIRIALYLSCVGFYKPIYNFSKIISYFKNDSK